MKVSKLDALAWVRMSEPEEPAKAKERGYVSMLVMLMAARQDLFRLGSEQLPAFGVTHKVLLDCLRNAENEVYRAEEIMTALAEDVYPGIELPLIVRKQWEKV